MIPAQSLQACSPELASLLRDIARSTSSARLAGSPTPARTEATAHSADLADLHEQLQAHQREIQTLYAALRYEAADLTDEQLASIAAGRIDIRTMVLTLAGTLSIATSDGALLLGTTAGMVGLSQATPVQAALQMSPPQQPAWMQQALSIIKEFEGLELADYIDVAGIATLV